MCRLPIFPAASALFVLALPGAADAAPVSAMEKSEGQVVVLRPLTLVKLADMEFATLGVTTGGTATIDPISGNMTLTGGLFHLGGTPSPAQYAGAASRQTVVNIRVPKQPVLIRRVGGTETLSVSNFTLDGQDKKSLAQQQSFHFAVGARITVPANTVEGLYEGEINVTVHYP